MVNSYFKGIKRPYGDPPFDRLGSIEDVEQIKKTCAHLGIDLINDDIVLDKKRKTILNKIQTVGASKRDDGIVYEIVLGPKLKICVI